MREHMIPGPEDQLVVIEPRQTVAPCTPFATHACLCPPGIRVYEKITIYEPQPTQVTPVCIPKPVLKPPHVPFLSHTPHSNLRWLVIRSTSLLGAGPTPSTVRLLAAICVRPASWITSATTPRLRALAISSSISSSLLVCTAILACPSDSHCRRICVARASPFCEALTSVL